MIISINMSFIIINNLYIYLTNKINFNLKCISKFKIKFTFLLIISNPFSYLFNNDIDIDGTLLTPEGKVSERTKNIICKVLNKYPDLHFVLASGRARPATQKIREVLNIMKRPNTESLLTNGCVIYSSDNKILYQNTIPTEFFIRAHKIVIPSPENTYLYSIGDDAFTYSEYWAKVIKDKYEEQTVVIDKDEFIKKIETGEVKVNKFCLLVKDPEEANSK